MGPQEAAGAIPAWGRIYTDAKEWNQAEKHLLAALECTPDDFMDNYCLALVYLNIDWGEMNWAARGKALVFAEKASQLDPAMRMPSGWPRRPWPHPKRGRCSADLEVSTCRPQGRRYNFLAAPPRCATPRPIATCAYQKIHCKIAKRMPSTMPQNSVRW